MTEGVPKVCRGMLPSQVSSLKCIFNFVLNGIDAVVTHNDNYIRLEEFRSITIGCLVLYIYKVYLWGGLGGVQSSTIL